MWNFTFVFCACVYVYWTTACMKKSEEIWYAIPHITHYFFSNILLFNLSARLSHELPNIFLAPLLTFRSRNRKTAGSVSLWTLHERWRFKLKSSNFHHMYCYHLVNSQASAVTTFSNHLLMDIPIYIISLMSRSVLNYDIHLKWNKSILSYNSKHMDVKLNHKIHVY